jgi:hypothetical protein
MGGGVFVASFSARIFLGAWAGVVMGFTALVWSVLLGILIRVFMWGYCTVFKKMNYFILHYFARWG